MRRIGNIWYGLSLRKKLIVYFSVLIVIALGIVFYSFRTTYFYIERFQTTLEEHFRLNAFLKELQSHGTLLDDMSRYKTENAFRETAALLDTGIGREETLLAQIKKTAGDTKEALFEIRALENCLELYRRLISDIARETDKRSGDFFQKMNTVFRLRFYMEQYTANLQRIRLTESAAYYDTIERSIAFSRWMFFSVLSAVVLMCIRFAFLFSKYFSEPISKLAEFAERMASGDLSVPPVKSEYASGKEIATLITAFNTMCRNIKDMIDDLKMKSQLEKMLHAAALEKESALGALREAQLVSLQNQIPPHFLFNTLNTIGRQAQEEHAEQTAKLILFLSHLMRYNLLSHRQSVPLIDELHALEDYIHLQQKRRLSGTVFTCDDKTSARAYGKRNIFNKPVRRTQVLNAHVDALHEFCTTTEVHIHFIAVAHRFELIFGRAQKTAHAGIVRKFNRIVSAAKSIEFVNILFCKNACDIRMYFFDAHAAHQNAGGLSHSRIVRTQIVGRPVVGFKKNFKGKKRHKPFPAVRKDERIFVVNAQRCIFGKRQTVRKSHTDVQLRPTFIFPTVFRDSSPLRSFSRFPL